jgi:hypothetical protein
MKEESFEFRTGFQWADHEVATDWHMIRMTGPPWTGSNISPKMIDRRSSLKIMSCTVLPL